MYQVKKSIKLCIKKRKKNTNAQPHQCINSSTETLKWLESTVTGLNAIQELEM